MEKFKILVPVNGFVQNMKNSSGKDSVLDNLLKPLPTIKIFVSHRTDLISETIDNPLYVNVRCGAIDDAENKSGLIGDDTGDNISEKKYQYSELSVQYWSWKNVKADYYGLCHYRRYLSFATSDTNINSSELNQFNQIVCDSLNPKSAKNFGLLDKEHMENLISQYDLIVNDCCDIRKINTPEGRKSNLFEHWKTGEDVLFPKKTIENLLSLVQTYYSEYYQDFLEYLHGWKHRGFNCFVMKKSIFDQFCSFEFDVLSKLEQSVDIEYCSETMSRTVAYMGEIIYGAFVYHLIKQKKYRVKELKLILFKDINRQICIQPMFNEKNVPIVIESSKYEIPYTAVLLESILAKTSKAYNYDIIILHEDIPEEYEHRLCSIDSDYNNISIRFFKTQSLKQQIEYTAKKAVSPFYYKLLSPWALTKYNKIIWLSNNLVVNTDLAELYRVDLSQNSIGAVKDIYYQAQLNFPISGLLKYSKNILKLKYPYNYTNKSVLIINLERIRKQYKQTNIVEICTADFKNFDADAVNIIFEGDIRFLDLRWNYYTGEQNMIKHILSWAPRTTVEKFRKIDLCDLSNSPFIIQYISYPLSWDCESLKYMELWWQYASRTDFYYLLLTRMSKEYYRSNTQISFARKVADKLLPKGTTRREALKKIIPRNSPQWNFLKKIYHFFALD